MPTTEELLQKTSIEHAGDCSLYQDGSDICDCGALRSASRDSHGKEDNDVLWDAWARHLDAINRSKFDPFE